MKSSFEKTDNSVFIVHLKPLFLQINFKYKNKKI